MMSVLLSHSTGNRNVRAVLEALERGGLLARFATTLAFNSGSPFLRRLPRRFSSELARRSYAVASSRISLRPHLELARMVLPKIGLGSAVAHESGWACVDAVYRDLDCWVASSLRSLVSKEGITAVYAYEDGALETFRAAKELGLKCIYDLPIAYWETGRSLMAREAERLPAWAGTLGGGIRDSAEKLERKTHELELADVVVGPGSFVMDSLPSWASGKRRVVCPFGSPEEEDLAGIERSEAERELRRKLGKPLRVLFAGSMSQRKGLGDLFGAMKMLGRNDAELVVMGSLQEPMSFYQGQLGSFTYEPGRPHGDVLKLMRSCDVFCLPSIVEGRALVMQEAMSQGLPLIITPNTGGEDLVITGKTGFLVPICSPEMIAERIEWFAMNRENIPEMSRSARRHSAKYTWEAYGDGVVEGMMGGERGAKPIGNEEVPILK